MEETSTPPRWSSKPEGNVRRPEDASVDVRRDNYLKYAPVNDDATSDNPSHPTPKPGNRNPSKDTTSPSGTPSPKGESPPKKKVRWGTSVDIAGGLSNAWEFISGQMTPSFGHSKKTADGTDGNTNAEAELNLFGDMSSIAPVDSPPQGGVPRRTPPPNPMDTSGDRSHTSGTQWNPYGDNVPTPGAYATPMRPYRGQGSGPPHGSYGNGNANTPPPPLPASEVEARVRPTPPGGYGGDGWGPRGSYGGSGNGGNSGGGGSGGGGGGGNPGTYPNGNPYHPKVRTFMVKPDPDKFPQYTSPDKFPDWFDKMTAHLGGYQMGNLAKFSWTPAWWEVRWFIDANHFLYLILSRVVQTIEGKAILREHRCDQDGRMALCKPRVDGRTSTAATLVAEELHADLLTRRLTQTHTKSYLSFITTFLADCGQYNERQLDNDTIITPRQQRAYLERAVEAIGPLRQIRDRERQDIALGRLPLTPDQYIDLLKQVAGGIDRKRIQQRRATRTANLADSTSNQDSSSVTSDNIEELVQFMCNKAMIEAGVRMDPTSFKELSVDGKKAWARLSSKDKSTILQASKEAAVARQVNLHELSIDGSNDGEHEDHTAEGPTETTEVNEASITDNPKSKAMPQNVNRMMSTSAAKKPNSTSKSHGSRSANHVKWSVNNVNISNYLNAYDHEDPGLDGTLSDGKHGDSLDAGSEDGEFDGNQDHSPWEAYMEDIDDIFGELEYAGEDDGDQFFC